MPWEIPIVFHNGSNYDYHFNIKVLEKKCEGQITCLGENTQKYITFSVSVEQEVTRIDKKTPKSQKLYLSDYNLLTSQDLWQAPYQILLIISLKEFIELSVNTDTIIKNVKREKYCDCCLEYINVTDDLIKCKCFCCNNNYQRRFGENLMKWFLNTYKCSNHYINKFILLLRKGVYPYENMDD